MKLFHTGNLEIPDPDIHHGRVNADFGQGFYLTPDEEFTRRWARKDSVINVYELDTTDLDIHIFKRDEEWFRYIFSNRKAKDTVNSDVVMGPISNDTIYDTLGVISSGHLKPEEALKLLSIGPVYTQLAIKTEKAVNQLKWIYAEKSVRSPEFDEMLKKEQEEYLKEFARVMKAL